ncbi:DUF3889 domain-containing protein [Sporosarcina sp. NPDC096371]|uniref:DUF3889 domain-containing protein n=1 Tax=Sporosarcina sp. NPDC096371 TaxID=3364530 RepID=UPI00381E3E7A
MKKTVIALGVIITAHSVPASIPAIAQTPQEVPTYAKWGKLAMKETQAKYPNAHIIDYLHEGSESNEDSTIEKFKLWLKDDNHEFGVFIRIEYTTETEKVVKIEFQETSR